MNRRGVDPTIRRLRGRLILARQLRDMALLREVEEALVYLGQCEYRCCLVDFSRESATYYVRLLGYEQARVKVLIEYPIAPELDSIQWVPLSHLADYSEVADPGSMRRMRDEIGAFIRRDTVTLARSRPMLSSGGRTSSLRGHQRRNFSEGNQHAQWLWWYFGAAILASCLLATLLAAD